MSPPRQAKEPTANLCPVLAFNTKALMSKRALPWAASTAVLERVRKLHQVPIIRAMHLHLMKLKYTRVVRTRMTRTKAPMPSREHAQVRTIHLAVLQPPAIAQRKIPCPHCREGLKFLQHSKVTNVTSNRSNLSIAAPHANKGRTHQKLHV